ncbi:MAG: DNA polymerase III subunit gamma/tau [Deltaproteobacteria bacterium]|nr:DNA polymerase III subunit gamma/tau [Deltaproteobacteria bacterium]
MSYQVISRKWRPSAFSEVVGQEHVVRTLSNAVKSGRVGHAYIFSGPRGVGKTTVARILAKCLQCEKGPTVEPCGTCEMCKGVSTSSSVDVLEIDGASNTGVDNIRELRESVKYAPTAGKYKIYIIDEVHMLSDSAFNALLKTLEEPPPHVVFIFATTEPHDIPLTIQSRCQRFDFRRVPLKKIHAHLSVIAKKENIEIDEEALYMIIREGEGSVRDSQSILEQVVAFSGTKIGSVEVSSALGLMDRSVICDLATAVIARDAKTCLTIVERIHDFGYDLKKAASDLIELVRDLTVIKVLGDSSSLDLPEIEAERLKKMASEADEERLQLLFAVISKGYEGVVRSSTPRFSLEMSLIGACSVEGLRPVSELISRFEALEKGSTSPRGPVGAVKGVGADVAAKAEVKKNSFSRPVSEDSGARTEPLKKVTAAGEAPLPKPESPAAASNDGEDRKESYDEEKTVDGFLKLIEKKDERLAKALRQGSSSFNGIDVEFAVDGAGYGMIIVRDALLNETARSYFGGKVSFKVLKSGAAEDAAVKPAPEDALVKAALKTFGGRIIDERRRGDV